MGEIDRDEVVQAINDHLFDELTTRYEIGRLIGFYLFGPPELPVSLPVSLLELMEKAPWYLDDLTSEEHSWDEVGGVRALRAIEENCTPTVRLTVASWDWPFDEDLTQWEVQALTYIGDVCQYKPDFGADYGGDVLVG